MHDWKTRRFFCHWHNRYCCSAHGDPEWSCIDDHIYQRLDGHEPGCATTSPSGYRSVTPVPNAEFRARILATRSMGGVIDIYRTNCDRKHSASVQPFYRQRRVCHSASDRRVGSGDHALVPINTDRSRPSTSVAPRYSWMGRGIAHDGGWCDLDLVRSHTLRSLSECHLPMGCNATSGSTVGGYGDDHVWSPSPTPVSLDDLEHPSHR